MNITFSPLTIPYTLSPRIATHTTAIPYAARFLSQRPDSVKPSFGFSHFADQHVEIKSEEQLSELLSESKQPVVVQFHAEWCGACKKQEKINDNLPLDLRNMYTLASVDIKELAFLAQKYNVYSLPTSLMYEKGKLKRRTEGLLTPNELANWLS